MRVYMPVCVHVRVPLCVCACVHPQLHELHARHTFV